MPLVGDAPLRCGQLEDLGILDEGVLQVRVAFERAEEPSECDVGGLVEVLARKEEDLVFEQHLAEKLGHRVVGPGEIEPGDLRSERGSQAADDDVLCRRTDGCSLDLGHERIVIGTLRATRCDDRSVLGVKRTTMTDRREEHRKVTDELCGA